MKIFFIFVCNFYKCDLKKKKDNFFKLNQTFYNNSKNIYFK